jgi:mRNA interferase RelE/StbE
MRSIVFTPAAVRQWTKLSSAVRARLRTRLEAFAATGHGDVKALKGRAGMRLRVGDGRVIFYEERNAIVVVVVVVAVGHRRDIYD